MNEQTFQLAAKRAGIGTDSFIYTASRMVLVQEISQAEAARRCLISDAAVSTALKRINKAIAQAQELAASINQQEEP